MRVCLLVAAFSAVFAVHAEAPLRVGVYGDAGPVGMGSVELMRWINRSPEMSLVVLSGEDVRNDALQDVDLLVLACGDDSTYDSLGETGRSNLIGYLRGGGKCLATGTGTTLLSLPTNATDKCLGVIPYKSRGRLDQRLSLAPDVNAAGAAALGVPSGYNRTLRYSGGPYLVAVANGVDGASFAAWATYRSEINLTGRVSNLMFGSVAIAGGTFGDGKVVVFTHEPQYESGKRSFVAGAIKWLTGRDVTIPLHTHALHAASVAIATDRVPLKSVDALVCALDADPRFDLSSVDAVGATFDSLEHLDALVFPDGSDAAPLVAGGVSRTLVEETAAAGVKTFVWGSGENLLPLADAVICADADDALAKLREAFPAEGGTGSWTRPAKVASPLRVTVFGDRGPCGTCAHEWYRVINDSPEMTVTITTGYQIRNSDILDRTDIFVVPGGNSSEIPSALMTSGIDKLKAWLKNGGRYFGTCCGCAILLQQQYYLSIAPFTRLGSVQTDWGGNYGVDFTAEAAAALGMTPGCHQYRYAEGPILAPGDPVADSTIHSWGTYCGEGQYFSTCNGIAAQQYGAPAMIAGDYGQGKVFAIALHPESYRSQHELIVKGFKWLTDRDVTIPKRNRKPGAVRVAVHAGSADETLSLLSAMNLAIDGDAAFELVLVNNADFANLAVEHIDAFVLPGAPKNSELANPSTVAGSCMREFLAAGGKCFGWGENAEVVRSFASQGVVCESAEDVYRALRETYQVTSEPSIHLHDWTSETNSVLSCTTPEIVVRTCHAAGCPTPVVTNTTAALGHDFTDWIVVTPSTATTRGLARRDCQRAGCDVSEEKSLPKVGETWYKVGVDPYGYSSWAKSYSATYGWAETAGGKVDKDHAVDSEVHYVVPEGTRLRTPVGGKSHTFAGKSLTLAGTLALNDTAGNSTKTITVGSLSVQGQAAVITVGNPNPAWTVAGAVEIPSGQRLTVNMFAESASLYSVSLAAALSGAGELVVNGNPATYAGYRSALTLGDAANFTGAIRTTNSRDMRCSIAVTGGFGGSVHSLPAGTASVVFNYDGLDAEKGLPVSTNGVPVALKTLLTLYSATADFSQDRIVLMSFPAGTDVSAADFTVKHAATRTGAAMPFTRLAALTAADGTVRLVANYCDHQWGEWILDREPTFLDPGARHRVCTVCGSTSARDRIDPLDVPDGYRAVAYVEAENDQFIDTGIHVQDKLRSDLTFVYTRLGAAYHMLGAWDKTANLLTMREYLVNVGSSGNWRGALADTSPVELTSLPAARVGETNHVVTVVNGTDYRLTVNGSSASMSFAHGVDQVRTQTHYLFAYNEDGGRLSASAARLFEAKIYTNETVLARQYLPVCKISTQVYGLYETVNGVFKGSATSTPFKGAEIQPENPVVGGEPVEPSRVFEKATSREVIVYPSSVTVTGEPGAQKIVFGATETAVPAYYTVSVGDDGKTVSLVLNDNAKPVFAKDMTTEPPTEPFTFEGGMVRIHVGNAVPSLYYALGFAAALDGAWQTNDYRKGAANFEDVPPADAVQRFYRVFATDIEAN